MTHAWFVAGTDTGVGKTLVASALVHGCAARGLRAAGLKPVAAGCTRVGEDLQSGDVEMLRSASNVILPGDIVNPYAFEPPLSPHIAARQAGVRIELERIGQCVRTAARQVDALVVEGVGGFRVPLSDTADTADLVQALGLPVILVVGMRLGCLNHALLSVEAIQARGVALAGWVANILDPAMLALAENLETLQARIPSPHLGTVPFQQQVSLPAVAASLNYGRLFSYDGYPEFRIN